MIFGGSDQSRMIKKIHYCWFGGKPPANVIANVNHWKRLNPDFEFCEWNDQNLDVSAFEFGRRTLANKRWGYLVDIIRVEKLYTQGGFYIDTDVEMIRPLRVLESEGDHLIMGYIYACALGTAILYSPPQHPVIGKLVEEYHHIRPDAWPVSNTVFTDYFINHVPGYLVDGCRWKNEAQRISLYPKEFFEQPAFNREAGLTIHHCNGSWMPKNAGADFTVLQGNDYSHHMKWLKRKVRTFSSMLTSEYRSAHLRALMGQSSTKPTPWRMAAQTTAG
jgi:mannosyltransferase OCH1-like enzyme